MVSEFQRNAILIGCVDYYCLVCHTHLKCEEEVSNHIAKPVHKKNIDSTPYLEDYKQELILKVKKGYYCIFCCLLIPTVKNVGIHVAEKSHVNNKGTLQLKRVGNSVSAFDELLISEKAWSGLTDDSCVLCQVEHEEENIHKSEPTHLLNLIKYKVEFDVPRRIYRMIEDNSFHCLTCNEVFSTSNIKTHFEETVHKNLVLKCMTAYKQSQHISSEQKDNKPERNQDKSTTQECQSNNDTVIDNKSLILATIENFEKNQVKIYLENETAFCRQCCMEVEFNYETMLNHVTSYEHHYLSNDVKENIITEPIPRDDNKTPILNTGASIGELDKNHNNAAKSLEHNTSVEIKTEGEKKTASDENIEEYSKKNKITFNKHNREADCQLCKVKIPAKLRSLKEHVNGLSHQNNLSKMAMLPKATSKKYIPKRKFKYFVIDVVSVSSLFLSEEIVNRRLCIEKYSFYMITRIGSSLRCQLCEESLLVENVETHVRGGEHVDTMMNTPIVTLPSLESEFIREVRSGLYHCGFCNLIAANWEELENHLKSKEHKNLKEEADARRQIYLVQMAREDAVANHFMRMLPMGHQRL